MTSRDFRAIADTIANLDAPTDLQMVAERFANMLSRTSPRFDRARFIAAATGKPLTKGDAPRARDYAR